MKTSSIVRPSGERGAGSDRRARAAGLMRRISFRVLMPRMPARTVEKTWLSSTAVSIELQSVSGDGEIGKDGPLWKESMFLKCQAGRPGLRSSHRGLNEREERFFLDFGWGIEYFGIPCTADWIAISRQQEAGRRGCCPVGSSELQLLVFAMTDGETVPVRGVVFSDLGSRARILREVVRGGLSQRSGG